MLGIPLITVLLLQVLVILMPGSVALTLSAGLSLSLAVLSSWVLVTLGALIVPLPGS